MKTNYLFFLAISTLVTSCGPVYDTFYDLTPPTSQRGKACIVDCNTDRRKCIQEEKYLNEKCEARVARQEADCERNKIYEYDDGHHHHRHPKCIENCYCYIESCDGPDLDACEEDYRFCFEACGGTVKSYTKCVAFCDKAR